MILAIVQMFVGLGLIASILLQMQGSGLSGAFGGSGDVYRSKRSIEKFLVVITIVLAFLFGTLSVVLLVPR